MSGGMGAGMGGGIEGERIRLHSRNVINRVLKNVQMCNK